MRYDERGLRRREWSPAVCVCVRAWLRAWLRVRVCVCVCGLYGVFKKGCVFGSSFLVPPFCPRSLPETAFALCANPSPLPPLPLPFFSGLVLEARNCPGRRAVPARRAPDSPPPIRRRQRGVVGVVLSVGCGLFSAQSAGVWRFVVNFPFQNNYFSDAITLNPTASWPRRHSRRAARGPPRLSGASWRRGRRTNGLLPSGLVRIDRRGGTPRPVGGFVRFPPRVPVACASVVRGAANQQQNDATPEPQVPRRFCQSRATGHSRGGCWSA